MLRREQSKSEEKLLLGDYVAVQVLGVNENRTNPGEPANVLLQYEDFFQRILKQRRKLKEIRKKEGRVIKVGKPQSGILLDSQLKIKAG